MSWLDKVRAKRTKLRSEIPTQWQLSSGENPSPSTLPHIMEHLSGMLNDNERAITEGPTEVLLSALRESTLTARETLLAFAHRASLAMQFVRALLRKQLMLSNTNDVENSIMYHPMIILGPAQL